MLGKASLLLKLSVDKDLRTVERVEKKGGKISQFFATVKLKLNEMFKVNILFILFALPLIALFTILTPYLLDKALSAFQFTSSMGIGYSTFTDSVTSGIKAIYDVYTLIVLYSIPAVMIASIGAAGMFYCARGYMWDEPVVIHKAFFRGIKKLWKKFLITFTIIALVGAGLALGILNNMKMIELGTADFLSYLIMILSIICAVIMLMISIFLLPMFACYKFNLLQSVKNSIILNMLVLPVSIIMVVITVIPFLLISIELIGTVFSMAIILIGFIFIAMMWTAFSQNIFYTMINGMYEARLESERKKIEKPVKKAEKVEFINPKKKASVRYNKNPKDAKKD